MEHCLNNSGISITPPKLEQAPIATIVTHILSAHIHRIKHGSSKSNTTTSSSDSGDSNGSSKDNNEANVNEHEDDMDEDEDNEIKMEVDGITMDGIEVDRIEMDETKMEDMDKNEACKTKDQENEVGKAEVQYNVVESGGGGRSGGNRASRVWVSM